VLKVWVVSKLWITDRSNQHSVKNMPKYHAPRRGSLGYVRKRASRIYPRVLTWPETDKVKLLGFPVYKVGMLSVQEIYEHPGSIFHGIKRSIAATALEAPPIRVMGIRIYKLTSYGYKSIAEVWTPQITDFEKKYLRRKITLPKNIDEKTFEDKKNKIYEFLDNGDIDRIRLIIRTRPEMTGIGKKKPEVLELQVGGSIPESLNYAFEKIGQEINISDVFTVGQFVDVIGVTKGMGFQGVVKRFGVKLLPPKKKKTKRAVGSLGPWTPSRVMWTVPRYGQYGYFKRTEYNKQILSIITDNKIEKFNPRGGWNRYGIIRNPSVVLRGSVQGPPKRLLVLRDAIRPQREPMTPTILGFYYSKEKLNV